MEIKPVGNCKGAFKDKTETTWNLSNKILADPELWIVLEENAE